MDYTKLRKKLSPDKDGEPPTYMRVGTVSAINSDGTLDIIMSDGSVVPGVFSLDHIHVSVGSVVQIISFRGSMLVIGVVSRGAAYVTAFVTSNPTTVSTTYSSLSGGDILGVAFVAPPSGSVEIAVQGWLGTSSTTVGRRSLMSPQVREGGSINSGTVVTSASDDYAAMAQGSVASSFDYKYAHHVRVVTGLTPGSTYNAVAMHKVVTSGDTSATNDRHIIVRPL